MDVVVMVQGVEKAEVGCLELEELAENLVVMEVYMEVVAVEIAAVAGVVAMGHRG